MRIVHRYRVRTLVLILSSLTLAGWLIPPFFHAGRYRRVLQAGLESKLGRPVELGAVTFRLLPHPGFSIQDVVVKEDPRFGTEPFARVNRMECDLRWRSLWGSRLDCGKILLDRTALNIVRSARGKWNIEDFLRQSRIRSGSLLRNAGASSGGDQRLPSGAVPRVRPDATRSQGEFELEAREARVNFTLDTTKKPFILNGVRAQLVFDPSLGAMRFYLAGTPMRTDQPFPAPGAIELSGVWKSERNFDGPFQARVSTSGTLLYGWVPLLTSHNPQIYGLVSAEVQLDGSIHQLHLRGKMHLDQLHRWESLPPSTAMPVDISFSGCWDRTQDQLRIQKLDAAFAASHLRLTGMIRQVLSAPKLNLLLAAQRSHVQDLIALGSRLTAHSVAVNASGRVDGLLTIQGPWRDRRYGGLLAIRSLSWKVRRADLSLPEAEIRIDPQGAHLLPTELYLAPHLECVVQGSLSPVLPRGAGEPPAPGRQRNPLRLGSNRQVAKGRYELSMTARAAPLHELFRLARSLGLRGVQDLDTRGWGAGSMRLAGDAWPFSRAQVAASGDLHAARLLVPGLTGPIQLSRFHLEVSGRDIVAEPITAQIGSTTFSGWLKHHGPQTEPWSFDARTPHLSLEQSSLWFTALGHRQPLPILDLIPGLRTFAARRVAGKTIFASVNARGSFESPSVTFRSLKLRDFHAAVAISGREARVSNATFKVAGGKGEGSAEVNFKQAPARIAGAFNLADLRLRQVAWRLPEALRGIRGSVLAGGHFRTRGLTREEMTANLAGRADLLVEDVSFGSFDLLQAAARAASMGFLEPDRDGVRLPSATLRLTVQNKLVTLSQCRLLLSGATVNLAGDYGFDGIANLYVLADLSHVSRRWSHDAGPYNPQSRVATLHLAGQLNNMALARSVQTARLGQ